MEGSPTRMKFHACQNALLCNRRASGFFPSRSFVRFILEHVGWVVTHTSPAVDVAESWVRVCSLLTAHGCIAVVSRQKDQDLITKG